MIKRNRLIKSIIEKEWLFLVFAGLLVVLSVLNPLQIADWPRYIDFKTLKALFGLLVVTAGIEESRCFYRLTILWLNRVANTARLALVFIIIVTAVLASFLTNDVALFIVVPLTLGLRLYLDREIVISLVALETISANIGSALTPIGNPQNLFLWHNWKISFIGFVGKMLPLVLISMSVLILMVGLIFNKRPKWKKRPQFKDQRCNFRLFIVSILMLLGFVIAMETGFTNIFLGVIVLIYSLFWPRAFKRVDWMFLVLVALVFVDFGLLSQSSWVGWLMKRINLEVSKNVFLASVVLSQVISNVPASVLMAKFTTDWYALSYGVNVGGNGLILASFANLIALRLVGDKRFFVVFFGYSFSFLVIITAISLVIFF